MPDSIEQLDLLLMTIAKERLVRRDGIRVLGFRYFDVSLTNGYIGEYVTVRYDPRDLAQVHVYSNNSLICKASCAELSGKKVTLKRGPTSQKPRGKIAKAKAQRASGNRRNACSYATAAATSSSSLRSSSAGRLSQDQNKEVRLR